MTPSAEDTAVEKRQRDYYNSISAEYDSHYFNKYAIEYRNRLFHSILKDLPLGDMTVLDAACGGGENTGFFIAAGCKVSGLDISDAQCQIYHNRFPDCPVTNASLAATGLPDATFDFVVTESLHHTHPRLNDCVTEIHRILKPGGYFLAWEPESGSFIDKARKLWYRLESKYFQENESSIDFDRLIARHANKFRPIRVRYGGGPAHLFVLNSMHFRIPPRLTRYYARPMMAIESAINLLNFRLFSMWGIMLLQRIDD